MLERFAARPYDGVTPEAARAVTLSEAARAVLPGAELSVVVDDRGAAPDARRVAVRLRWRQRSGEWDAPVRSDDLDRTPRPYPREGLMIAIAPRARRGFTLVELLVVIGGVAVTLGMCVALIQSLLRLDRGARLHLAETSAVGRIGHQFRQDVRAASRAKEDASRLELALAAPDERIVEYEERTGSPAAASSGRATRSCAGNRTASIAAVRPGSRPSGIRTTSGSASCWPARRRRPRPAPGRAARSGSRPG